MECIFADLDLPNPKGTAYTTYGNSPVILKKLITWLNQLDPVPEQLEIALFLFNNHILYQALDQLSRKGCRVTIYSIPLEGYDNRARMDVYDPDTGNIFRGTTKYQIANNVYSKIRASTNSQLELRIVSKMYIRSQNFNDFSRGKWPYALHCKTFHLVQCQPEGVKHFVGISSSNLAVRDEMKIELYSLMKLTTSEELQNCCLFYAGLHENSSSIKHFREPPDPANNTAAVRYYYNLHLTQNTNFMEVPPLSPLLFSAPFFENSPFAIEAVLHKKIQQAKERIYICGEHLSAYICPIYKEGLRTKQTRQGILFRLLERVKNETRPLIVTLVSQTSALLPNARRPQNPRAFIEFENEVFKLIKAGKNIRFIANGLFHAKLYIFDNDIVVTTDNVTPTQFDYIKDDHFSPSNNPNYTVSGVFCEYGVFAFIRSNKELADKLINRIESIIQQ